MKIFIQDTPEHGLSSWLEFREPDNIVCAYSSSEIKPMLTDLAKAVERGQYIAGFMAYEGAQGLDLAAKVHNLVSWPLACFGIFNTAIRHQTLPGPQAPFPDALHWKPAVDKSTYCSRIDKIRSYLKAGDTYQVNYTFPMTAGIETKADYWAMFVALQETQQGQYGAFFEMDDHLLMSCSPELFFRLEANRLVSKPMKGTASRGQNRQDDETLKQDLHHSTKNRSENVMIVDMIRNDMGRIAVPGTVKVDKQFEVETYPTIHQMTSTVSCTTQADLDQIFEAMFPCASITGAPKLRSMEIIHETEGRARGVYTGTIGYMSPDQTAQFNVAIRTISHVKTSSQYHYGVGSGIVWDSDTKDEYAECLNKSKVLESINPEFCLLETILWEPETGFFLLDHHLERILESAMAFGFEITRSTLTKSLHRAASDFKGTSKVRLLLSPNGSVRIESSPAPAATTFKVCLDSQASNTHSLFCIHKTTRRHLYDQARSRHPEYDDVILWNRAGELTETSFFNLVLNIDGELFTPCLSSGLLAGTYRKEMLLTGRITEKKLKKEDLDRASEVFLINSVRKWIKADIQACL
jgi:para-aminobenzoate synthetase/4-amino-4-deoxychorismate lyase